VFWALTPVKVAVEGVRREWEATLKRPKQLAGKLPCSWPDWDTKSGQIWTPPATFRPSCPAKGTTELEFELNRTQTPELELGY
jgi:hypothetical protein